MDRINRYFLQFLKSALEGRPAEQTDALTAQDWERLLRMAELHGVLPIFFEAVYPSASLQKTCGPLAAAAKRQVIHQVLIQALKTREFLQLNRHLQAGGIRPLVVKGIVCRNLYPQPDHRLSSDEDVLILPEQFDRCHRLMLDFGMQTSEAEPASSYEVPYRKNGSPLYIELHKHLFPPESEAYGDLNRFFNGIFDRAIPEDIQGIPVYTMEYTDHLFYLICHAFKHFLHSGFGIRQVCDIVLYANRYGSRIDWVRILKQCRAIKADLFAAALFRIGKNYLVFDPEQAHYPQMWQNISVDETAMLEDLLCGGLYGNANLSRKHSSNITLDAVAAHKKGKRPGNSLVVSLFPPAKKLESQYPYLKKQPYLLPVAWGERIRNYARETKTTRNNTAAGAWKIGSERVELMKQYGIIGKRTKG